MLIIELPMPSAMNIKENQEIADQHLSQNWAKTLIHRYSYNTWLYDHHIGNIMMKSKMYPIRNKQVAPLKRFPFFIISHILQQGPYLEELQSQLWPLLL